MFELNPNAGIANLQMHRAGPRRGRLNSGAYDDFAPAGEFQRVTYKVGEYLAQAVGIAGVNAVRLRRKNTLQFQLGTLGAISKHHPHVFYKKT